VTASETSRDSEFLDAQEHNDWESPFQPTLRRTTSHESILSIAGLDIHTLKSHPSQMTITGGFLRPRTRLGTPTTVVSMDTTTTAVPTLSRHGHNSTSYLRANMLAHGSDARSISSSGSNEAIGSKLGGWVFGKWGASPSKPQQRVASTPIVDSMKAFMGRPPGINQKGPVPGFVKKIEKAPSKVIPEVVNHDALREVLMEGGLP
jgi:hypothetical protein